MNVVLVCIQNYQSYILLNIQQLIKLGHKKIYVLTNNELFHYFIEYIPYITLIDINQLNDSYDFYDKTTLNKSFRSGFWTFTSLRFFYIYEFMNQYNISDVIHIENDVLLYYNCDILYEKLNKKYMYIPFDTMKRNVASIVYIPNIVIFKNILDKYDFKLNDMENFYKIRLYNCIENFPIFINDDICSEEYKFVTYNYPIFKFVFDAAAMGQYLGGIDPRNNSSNTIGFVNETCVIKYNNFQFIWKYEDNIKKPFLIIYDKEVPIFNLHIHSKQLINFI